jgi:hypothetical protein
MLRKFMAIGTVVAALSCGTVFAQDTGGRGAGGGGAGGGGGASSRSTGGSDDTGFDLGWIGLAGLAGLAGLMPRKEHRDRHVTTGHAATH